MVLTKNKYGQKIWVNEQGHIGEAIINKGIYDPNAIYYIEQILQLIENPICLDIGAHLGNHALIMSRLSKMVYCFDPVPSNIHFLTKTKNENNIKNMKIFCMGLSDKNEKLIFYKNGRGGFSTFVSDLKGTDYTTENLTCAIGDEILTQNNIETIDFIKIDIEGFEARALYGLRNSIQNGRPIIMMEWNNKITKEQFKKYDLFKTLFKNYQIYSILNNHHHDYWGNKWSRQIMRFFYRKWVKKRRLLAHFDPQLNYANVILFPKEKGWVCRL